MTIETGELCAICQDELNDGSEAEALKCGHCFHVECIDKVMSTQNISIREELKCPVCKLDAAAMSEREQDIVVGTTAAAGAAGSSEASQIGRAHV